MNSMWKRSFALLLSLVMVFGMVPVNAFAEGTECSHSYEATVTDPTCTAAGFTTYTCACGDTYTADEVAATGHSYADGICSVCGAEEHTHSYEAVVTAPTCGEAGFTTYTCACGHTYTADEVAATGHSYADGVCSICGAAEVKACSVDENCEAETHDAECPMGPCTLTEGCELVKGHEALGVPCTGRDTYEEEIPEGAVAVLAGTEIYVTDLNQAFTEAVNPDKKSVLMIADCTQNVEVTSGQAYSFYLNGYTLTGTFKLSSGVVNFYGAQSTGPSGTIQNTGLDGNYAIHCGNGNLNLGAVNVVATGTNGTAVYADGSKLNIIADANVVGNVETSGIGILNIEKGNYTGSLIKGTGTALTVTGGTFSEDPSHCLPEGYEAVLKDGKYVVEVYEASLDELEQDTSGAYLISDADDVVLFRTLLNVSEGKNILSGVAFKQTKDIDMARIILPPAGSDSKRFMGSFDGQGFTISNVNIEAEGQSYVAFFGNTSGATIKNVTLHNISVSNPGGTYTAGLVGYTRNTIITNCAITGEISISGGSKVGGIHAGGVVDITGCSVDGTGTISGTIDVGAISGLISQNSTVVKNNAVKGITVKGDGLVGGLVGRAIAGAAGLSIANNTMENTKVESSASSYPQNGLAVGATQAIDGVATYEDNTFTNSTLTEAGVSSNVIYGIENYDGTSNGTNVKTDIVAYVGDTPYATLLEALEAAIETGASTVEMVNSTREKMPTDVEIMLTNDLTITANAAVVADFYNEGTSFDFIVNSKTGNHTFTIDTNVTFQIPDRRIWLGYYGNDVDVVVKGTMSAYQIWHGADTLVTSTGTLSSTGEAFVMRRGATMSVEGGTVNANYFSILAGNIDAKNATIQSGPVWIDNNGGYAGEGSVAITLDNTQWNSTGNLKMSTEKTAVININNGSNLTVANIHEHGASTMDAESTVNVNGGTLSVAKELTNSGIINVSGNSKLTASNITGGTVNVAAGTVLTDTTLGGTATTKFANGEISFNGKNEITTGVSGSPFGLKVNEGATLLITRFVLGYGRNITVNGNIAKASDFKPGDATPALKANSSSGFSIGGTGENTLTAKNAYLDFASSCWKDASGKYDWTFENSYVKAVSFGVIGNSVDASAAWTVTFDGSVLDATNYIKPAAGVTYNFTNGSVAETGSLRVEGVLNIDETSSVDVTGYQNNKVGSQDEHGDISGEVNVAGELTIDSNAVTTVELLGGEMNVLKGAKVALGKHSMLVDNTSVLTVAVGSEFGATSIKGNGKIVIDAKDYAAGMDVPVDADVSAFTGTVETINSKLVKAEIKDGRIVFIGAVAKIGDQGYFTFEDAVKAIVTDGSDTTIELLTDVEVAKAVEFDYGTGDVTITAKKPVTIKQTVLGSDIDITKAVDMNLVIDENVTIEIYDNASGMYMYYGPSLTLNGTITGGQNWGCLYLFNGKHTVTETGKVSVGRVQVASNEVTVNGEINTNYLLVEAATFIADGAAVTAGVIHDSNNGSQRLGASDFVVKNEATVTTSALYLKYADSTLTVDLSSQVKADKICGAGKIIIDAEGYVAGTACPVIGDVSEFTGTVETINNNFVRAEIKDNKIVFVDAVAEVDNMGYYTLEAAVAAANGKKTVTLLADIPADPEEDADLQITVPMNVDLNGHTLKADFNGTLTMNGGTYRNANGFQMVAPETANDASAYAYNSSDAVLKISAEGIDITKGTMTIGLPGGMGTDPNHKLQLLKKAKLVIPEGKHLVLRSEAYVADTATVEGTILLEGNGTITTTKELSVASATADRKVVYVDGVYKLVSDTAKAVIGNKGYENLADAIEDAKPGDTIKLVEDVTENVQINDAVTVDLNGKTLTGKITSKNDSAKVKSNGVTIELGKEDAVTSDSTGVLTVAPNLDEVGYGSVKIRKNGVTTTYFTSKDTKTGQLATVTVSANGVVKTHGKVIVGAQANGKPAYNYTITQSNVHSNNHVRNTSPDMVISCNGFLAACDGVYITGGQYGTGIHDVYKNGSAQNGFSVVDGSTQVTLSQAYLNSLHDGNYTMVFKYKDGEQVKAPFVVSTYYNANADKTNPKTGDEIALPMFVMFSTAAALAVLVMGKKKYF